MRGLAKRRINESMSSRLLRRTRTARPDNDLAARTWRIHDRMGAPPYWRNNDNVEVRPEIHDHSVETRRDSAAHPTQGRRYVQVKETGWKEIVPPDMPFDVNRLREPLVSMSRFWPNVQPDQPPLKFAEWFQKILEYMKHMDARHPETSAQFGTAWWSPSDSVWHRGSATEYANLLAEPKAWLPDISRTNDRTQAEERREWNKHADDHDCIIRYHREYTASETDSDTTGPDDDSGPNKRRKYIYGRAPDRNTLPWLADPEDHFRRNDGATTPGTSAGGNTTAADRLNDAVMLAAEPEITDKVSSWLSASPTRSTTLSTITIESDTDCQEKFTYRDVARAVDRKYGCGPRPHVPPARPSSQASDAPPRPRPMAAKSSRRGSTSSGGMWQAVE